MLMTVAELRRFVETEEDDQVLEAMLQALELSIQGYTNNNFKRVIEEHGGEYPMDIKLGAVNMLKWELNYKDKVSVSSETISRHSVTYVDMNGNNSAMGYPNSLLGFLRPYKRARFGRGIGV